VVTGIKMPDYSKLDHWSLKAQKDGYPARSVYKLQEMDEKFGLIKSGKAPIKILDLGAAPGSWSLYILRKFEGRKGGAAEGKVTAALLLVAIDLAPLSRSCDQGLFDREDFVFIQGDFTQSEIKESIVSRGPYTLLVSDAAPATSGNRSLDTLRSLDLAENALDYAVNNLAQGGNLVIKIFQGGETANFLKTMRSLFETAKSFKPQACRAESFEMYLLGFNKR